MGFLGILNAYTMRITLSIAITEMVIPNNATNELEGFCPAPDPGGDDPPVTVSFLLIVLYQFLT